MSTTLSLC